MPQIPTYTASLTTPLQRTSEELSISSAQQTGAAAQNLGHELQRAGAIGVNISAQIMREKELRFASDAGQKFTQESIQWQQENRGREDIGDAFKEWSDQRIGQLASEAPNGRGAEAFKIHVLPQANSDWQQNLARGEATRLTNFKVGEDAASQSAQEAYRFRVTSGDPVAESLRVQDLKNSIARTTSAYGTVAPKYASAMNEDAVVSAVLGASEHNPAFARQLLNDFPLVDVNKRESLLAHIKTAEREQNQGALFDLTQSWESAFKVAQYQGKPSPIVPDERIFTALAGERGRQVHAQLTGHATIQNTSVSTIAELKSFNADAAARDLAEKSAALKPGEGDKADGLKAAHQYLAKQWEAQERDPVAWQMTSQEPVANLYKKASEAFAEASALPKDSPARADAYAKAARFQDQAFTLSKFLQGPAPAGASPDERKLFLNRTDTHVVTTATAEHYADQINSAKPEERIQLARSLKAQYGEHAADFFADLATLPSAGHDLSPALIQGLNIQNERHAAAYMQAQTGKGAEGKLDAVKFKTFTDSLDASPDWKKYMHGWLGEYNQRGKFMESSREGILNYATALTLGGQVTDPQKGVEMALKHVVTDQVGLADVNGRTVPIARETKVLGPMTGLRNRTDEEVNDVGRGLSILLRQLDPNELDRRPFVTAPPGEQGADFIMRRIWTNGYYVTDHDGQSATLYIPGDDGPIQVRDKQNRALRVRFDDVPSFTTTQRLTLTQSAMQHRTTVTRQQVPAEFEKGIGKRSIYYPLTKEEGKWNWPTTSKVFTYGP